MGGICATSENEAATEAIVVQHAPHAPPRGVESAVVVPATVSMVSPEKRDEDRFLEMVKTLVPRNAEVAVLPRAHILF